MSGMTILRSRLACLASLLALLCVPSRGEDPRPAMSGGTEKPAEPAASSQPADELSPEAQLVVDTLRAALPAESEARLMLEDIVNGSQLGPGEGWFRVALSQTRFDWTTVASRYDRNTDGRIERGEFPGSDQDFERLDRNRDQAVTESDLDWKEGAQLRSPGVMVFYQFDLDGNGKVTQEELLQVFHSLDGGGKGYLSLEEMRERFPAPGARGSTGSPDRPDRSTLVLGLARQEIGSLQPGPGLNEAAPDFSLPTLDGPLVQLSKEVGQVPVVLIFGNFSCGPFRSNSGDLEKLAARYQDRAKILLIYVREAHPSDGWWMMSNQRVGIDYSQPKTDEERCDVAGRCRQHLQLALPFLVDSVGDAVGARYSGMPNRLYLIDREGRIAFKSGRGPFGFRPAELEQALIWLLADSPPPNSPPANAK